MRAPALWLVMVGVSGCLASQAPVLPQVSPVVATTSTAANDPPREVLVTFVQAVKAKQFQVAYGCVSARWHRAYASVEAFAADSDQSALALERVERLAHALEHAPVVTVGNAASIALSDTRGTLLLKQGDEWVIDELDGKLPR